MLLIKYCQAHVLTHKHMVIIFKDLGKGLECYGHIQNSVYNFTHITYNYFCEYL